MEVSSQAESNHSIEEDDVFNITISTDNHMGYKESDPIIGEDSFLAFEEVLQTAQKNESDFLLLGGDLFHEKKPSRDSINKVTKLLNTYVYGDQDIRFETQAYPKANYLSDFLSVKLPIFMIHGNHDDPMGLNYLSNIDFLYSSSLINYFGKARNIDNIEIEPILFTKGCTKIALYGIGHIKDERLNYASENGKLHFKRPLKEDGKPDENYFNILVVHQNRFKGCMLGVSRRHSITDEFFPSFIHLVIWGHEHECIPEAVEVAQTGVHILQPGSSVATSLIKAESEQKCSFQLQIYKKAFKLVPTPMKNTRPILYKQISLKDSGIDPRRTDVIERYLQKLILNLLKEYNFHDKPLSMKTPLLRLKIEYTGYQVIRSKKLIDFVMSKIANPNGFLQFFKRKEVDVKKNTKGDEFDLMNPLYDEKFANQIDNSDTNKAHIEKLMVESMRK